MIEHSKEYLLTINCGSSSLKFCLYDRGSLAQEWSGAVNHISTKNSRLLIKNVRGDVLSSLNTHYHNIQEAVKAVIGWLKERSAHYSLAAVSHRLVQGGPDHRQPEFISNDLLKTLDHFVYLAPNHLPDEIQAIKAFQAAYPDVAQVACYDTAFHKDLPDHSKYYPLKEKYQQKGLIKYGFHGLSYEFIMHKLAEKSTTLSRKKIIIAHLGNGASMAAVKHGISIDTTMGLSPIGGLVMGTRCGDLDPGVLLFLLNQEKLSADQLDEVLSKESGLIAIAGTSDVQELLSLEKSDLKAAAAIKTFCYSSKKFIGALAAAMGGLDLLVFTGGIGENSAVIRERICKDLEFMGIFLDQRSNDNHIDTISKISSRVKVRVIATDEEFMMAQHTQQLLKPLLK